VGPYGAGAGSGCQFELRAFAAPIGIAEDPVTGSLNASVAQWLMDQGVAPSNYLASQGARLGRAGRVSLAREGETLWVGGHSVSCIRGQLTL
jgi:PhzF family phenazine biosynthesis protein